MKKLTARLVRDRLTQRILGWTMTDREVGYFDEFVDTSNYTCRGVIAERRDDLDIFDDEDLCEISELV